MYDIGGWMQKNKDTLNEDVVRAIMQSTNSFILELFRDEAQFIQESNLSSSRSGPQRAATTNPSSQTLEVANRFGGFISFLFVLTVLRNSIAKEKLDRRQNTTIFCSCG